MDGNGGNVSEVCTKQSSHPLTNTVNNGNGMMTTSCSVGNILIQTLKTVVLI